MRKWTFILALGVLCGTAQADAVKKKLDLTYNLLLKQGNALVSTSVLEGLETGDSFRLNTSRTPKARKGGPAAKSTD